MRSFIRRARALDILVAAVPISAHWLQSADLPPDLLQTAQQFSSPKRQLDFIGGRLALLEALALLDAAFAAHPPVVPIGTNGAPVMPQGVLGSVSHSGNWALAAVHRGKYQAIGVDIECRQNVRAKMRQYIAHPQEPAYQAGELVPYFSCKESVFKAAQNAQTLKEIQIILAEHQQFTAQVLGRSARGIYQPYPDMVLSLAFF